VEGDSLDKIQYLLNGDSSILIKFGDEINEETNYIVNTFNKIVNDYNHFGITETIPLYCSLMIIYKPEIIKYKEIIDLVHNLSKEIKNCDEIEKEVIEIPVLYGGEKGPDLEYVAWYNNLSEYDVIKFHSEPNYLIYMLGFTPGFPYLGGLNKRISTPRLETPRVRIEAGSVGIAGEQTGVYTVGSPGGWQIIGQTPLDLYNANREEPILLKAGQYIKFKSITKKEFDKIKSSNINSEPLSFKSSNNNNYEEIKTNGIFIRNSGLLTTVQDLGRYKYQAFGVSVSGAMDQRSLRLANLLVGNDVDEAGLEVTMLGPTIEFMEDNVIAITGGDLMPQLNNVGISMNTALVCHKGDVLSFKGIKSGSRAYIAFAGGLSVPNVMGSKSTYTKASIGGFKGRKLEKGDEIGFENPKASIHNLSKRTLNINNQFSNDINLRVIMGPQEDYFTEEGLNTFLNSTYIVSNEFDRMGCRLEGEKIQHKKDGNIISDGIAFGAIQVPSHGTPIIMLADRQTVGGYTKIANIISVDLPKLAQAKPGDKISFLNVSVEEAQNLYIKELKDLEKLKEEFSIENKNNVTFYKIKLNNKIYDVSVEKL